MAATTPPSRRILAASPAGSSPADTTRMSACTSRRSGATGATVDDGSGVAAIALVVARELALGCHGSADAAGTLGIAPTAELTPAKVLAGALWAVPPSPAAPRGPAAASRWC